MDDIDLVVPGTVRLSAVGALVVGVMLMACEAQILLAMAGWDWWLVLAAIVYPLLAVAHFAAGVSSYDGNPVGVGGAALLGAGTALGLFLWFALLLYVGFLTPLVLLTAAAAALTATLSAANIPAARRLGAARRKLVA